MSQDSGTPQIVRDFTRSDVKEKSTSSHDRESQRPPNCATVSLSGAYPPKVPKGPAQDNALNRGQSPSYADDPRLQKRLGLARVVLEAHSSPSPTLVFRDRIVTLSDGYSRLLECH